MIMAYVLAAIVAGLIATVIAVVMQASAWMVLGVYSLVGGVILLGLPLALAAVGGGRAVAAPLPRAAPMPAPAAPAPMRILAVDDDPFILELIPMLSAKAGFPDVTTAASGQAALDILARGDARFDCFLFDITMPGMDGIALCRQVRAMAGHATTPILMLTAMRDLNNMGDAYRAGATDYATKPFDIAELGMRLRLAAAAGTAQQGPAPDLHADLPDIGGSLVDHAALTSYLTHLPRKAVAGVQVYAAVFDGLLPGQATAVLAQAATGAARCFAPDACLMAYTAHGTLVITTTANLPPRAIDIETQMQAALADRGHDLTVSVGDPTAPQGPRPERARLAMDGARARAALRAWHKRGHAMARAGSQ